MPIFNFTVDDEPFSTQEHTLTAVQILQMDGLDPDSYYLVEIHGKSEKSYRDNPNEPIHMHEKAKFVSGFKGGTTVS